MVLGCEEKFNLLLEDFARALLDLVLRNLVFDEHEVFEVSRLHLNVNRHLATLYGGS